METYDIKMIGNAIYFTVYFAFSSSDRFAMPLSKLNRQSTAMALLNANDEPLAA